MTQTCGISEGEMLCWILCAGRSNVIENVIEIIEKILC